MIIQFTKQVQNDEMSQTRSAGKETLRNKYTSNKDEKSFHSDAMKIWNVVPKDFQELDSMLLYI